MKRDYRDLGVLFLVLSLVPALLGLAIVLGGILGRIK